jgi:uncharacterized Tic20 family protein
MSNVSNLLTSGGIILVIVIVGIFVIWKIMKEKQSGFPAKDERTKKVTGMAATYAFYIGSYFMLALMFTRILSQEFLDIPFLEDGYTIIIAIIVQNLTFLGFRFYFNRKGDF